METELSSIVLLVGIVIIISILSKELLGRIGLPPMAGYIVIGIGIRALDSHLHLLGEQGHGIFEFLADVGVITLLFHIGLESKVHKLLEQLRLATFIGLVSIAFSAVLGFAVAYFFLHLSLLTSLIIACALTATSVGIPAGVWEETRAIKSQQGQLFLDVAELDDIVGVILMALLFSVAPLLARQTGGSIGLLILKNSALFAAKFIAFGLCCVVFARYAEKPITGFFQRLEKAPELTLTVAAMGFAIAALAGLIGFSVAIGAFFAGLMFSRDPASIKSRTAFNVIYDLFSPFFFIGIGLSTYLETIGPALVPAAALILAASAGKFIGATTPALLFRDRRSSVLLGVGMIPRAEVALIITQRSLDLHGDAMPNRIFSAMVITCLTTCIVAPIVLEKLIRRWL